MFNLTADQRRKRRTLFYLLILTALLPLLVASSYTWFSLSQAPVVSDLSAYVSAGTGLQLAARYDAQTDEWGSVLDFQTLVGGDTMLRPATWSQSRGGLITAAYSFDGRVLDNEYLLLNDETHANGVHANAYYVKTSFYARTDSAVEVFLGDAIELDGGEHTAGTYVIGTPIWNEQTILHDNGGNGAETAIRVGIGITPVDPGSGETAGQEVFYIYEPNCDAHIDPGITGDVSTPSVDGMDTLVDPGFLIRQTASTWTEASPVQQTVTIKDLGEFITPTKLFTLLSGEMVRIDLYIWLEGEDVDCSNLLEDAQIIANIQFRTEYAGQSGLEEIPGNESDTDDEK